MQCLVPLYCLCLFKLDLCAHNVVFLYNPNSSDCLLSDTESSSSDSPMADKRAPGSERAAERAAQQNERERIRLAPQTSFANMQVHTNTKPTLRQNTLFCYY